MKDVAGAVKPKVMGRSTSSSGETGTRAEEDEVSKHGAEAAKEFLDQLNEQDSVTYIRNTKAAAKKPIAVLRGMRFGRGHFPAKLDLFTAGASDASGTGDGSTSSGSTNSLTYHGSSKRIARMHYPGELGSHVLSDLVDYLYVPTKARVEQEGSALNIGGGGDSSLRQILQDEVRKTQSNVLRRSFGGVRLFSKSGSGELDDDADASSSAKVQLGRCSSSRDCSVLRDGKWGWGTLGNGCTLVRGSEEVTQD